MQYKLLFFGPNSDKNDCAKAFVKFIIYYLIIG